MNETARISLSCIISIHFADFRLKGGGFDANAFLRFVGFLMVINKCSLFANTHSYVYGGTTVDIRFIIFNVVVVVVVVESSAELVWRFRCLGAQIGIVL